MKKKLLTPDRGLKAITYHFVLLSPTKKIMKKIFLLLCAIGYIGIYVQPTYAQSNYGFLHRDNREIVNDDGPILLKGLNLGNWLVTEAYLWGWNPTDKNYSKFDAPTKFKNELFDLLGTQANVDLFYNTWRNNFLTEADVVEIANKGYNSIRVPFHSNQVYDIATDQFRTELFQYIDNLVTWCANNKIYVILDMHCAVGAQNKQGHSDYLGDNYLYSDDNYDQNINYKKLNAKVWKHIADHYKNEPWIGGYDLVNESVIDVPSEKWKLRDHYVAITNAIRTVDNNHIVFAEGNYYGSDLWDLDPRWDENMVYSIHNYWTEIPKTGINGIENQVMLAEQANLPLWLGETGENSNHWCNAHVRDSEMRNIGWCYWTYKKFENNTAAYSMQYADNYQTIIDYWKNNGPKPSTSDALATMLEMAYNTLFANCTENKDFNDALLRSDFHTTRKPFINHTIPGIINAVDYDMGANNIAYKDNVYQQITNSQATPWNSGFEYRNDGVDIEKCYDSQSTGYNVAYTQNDEWLKYTITVDKTDNYDIKVRVATVGNNQHFHIEIDGVNVTGSVNVPETGGYQAWRTITIEDVAITAGKRVMKFVFDNAGFNVSYIEFGKKPWILFLPAILSSQKK